MNCDPRIERIALEAYRVMYGERAWTCSGVTALSAPEAPASPMLNRVVGLGVDEPATEELFDAALARLSHAQSCYVAVSPGARPPELAGWLDARGLEPGWGWMLFSRGLDDPPAATTELEVARVVPGEADGFARIVCAAYALPDAVRPWLEELPAVPGWSVWEARDGDRPVATGALFVSERAGYLGFGGTLPEHRGRGGQNALVAARIRHARELGCDLLVTETGERLPDRPSGSYRNILRSGFREEHVVANRVGRPRR